MGKRKEKPTQSQGDPRELSSPARSLLHSGTPKEIVSKKSKKHKRKKSSRKERHMELKLPVSSNQSELGDTLIIDEVTIGMDHEITVDDIEMEVEEVFPVEFSGMNILKSTDPVNDKSMAGLRMMQKNKADRMKPIGKKSNKKKDGSKGEDDTDSEEERWLDAIESGKLEEVDDELKRIKNPRLMTARQRALMEKRSDGVEEGYAAIPAEPLLALPTGFKEKVLTEEMLAKKAIKSKRRREQAQEKREEDKKKTVDRLLKKQDSKAPKGGRLKSSKNVVPNLTYINSRDGIMLYLPIGFDYPIEAQTEGCPPKPTVCGAEGCFNLKKYSCSKTGIPLCSLRCYNANLTKWSSMETTVT